MKKYAQIGNLVLALLVQSYFSFEVRFLRVLKDKQLANHAILTISDLREVQCLFECAQKVYCGSVNYHVSNKVCVLNNDAKNEEEKELNMVDGIGWKYMEKSDKIEKEVINQTDKINLQGDHKPIKGQLINIIPVQLETWEIKFDMVIHKKSSVFTNIFHFTIGNDKTQLGDRTPALFLKDDILHFRFAKEQNLNASFNSDPMPLSTNINIRIVQHLCQGCPSKLRIYIDKVEVYTGVNQQPSKFRNVKCYLGNPWYQPAPVTVSNLKYTSHPKYFSSVPVKLTLGTFAILKKWPAATEWYVTAKVNVKTVQNSWCHIIRFDNATYPEKGSRTPLIAIRAQTRELNIYVDSSYNEFKRRDIPADVYTTFKARQVRKNDNYFVEALIDGQVEGETSTTPKYFDNVKIMWMKSTDGQCDDVWISDFDYGPISREVINITQTDTINLQGDYQPIKGQLINIIPVQLETWEITFDMVIREKASVFTNIFHFTIGNDSTQLGDRTPALFLRDDILRFRFGKDQYLNAQFNSDPMPLWTNINIRIIQHLCQGCPSKLRIYIDKVEVYTGVNQQPSQFQNVKCYLGNPWHQPAPVTVSNLKYTSYPKYFSSVPVKLTPGTFAILNQWPPAHEWYVTAKVNVKTIFNSWCHIIRFDNATYPEIGSRTPLIAIRDQSRNLNIYVDSLLNEFIRHDIPADVYTTFKARQVRKNGNYIVEALIDGQVKGETLTTPKYFDNVKIMWMKSSDEWQCDVWISDFDYGPIPLV